MRRITRLFITTLLVLLSLLLTLTSCIGDPGVLLYVNNKTDLTLSFYIRGVYQNDVSPGEIRKISTMEIWPNPNPPWGTEDYQYLIEAKTKRGEVVLSDNLTWQELDDMDWTIVILPLENHSENSENVTTDNITAK